MSKEPSPSGRSVRSAEAALADYLRAHPDFFNRHAELLEELRIPHPCRGAVSLVERQLQQLRTQNEKLRRKLKELIDVARENDQLFKRLQSITLTLIEASDLEEMLYGLQSVLREEFDADFTAFKLAACPRGEVSYSTAFVTPETLVAFNGLLRSNRPHCGRLIREQNRALFGEVAPQVASAVVIPLNGGDWQGILGIGSGDGERFQPNIGTHFLSCAGELISHALQPHLHPLGQPSSRQ